MADYKIYYVRPAYDTYYIVAEDATDAILKFNDQFDASTHTVLEVTYQ